MSSIRPKSEARRRDCRQRAAAVGIPLGTPGHPQHFPVRNRIVSGMSLGILVIEGAEYSGRRSRQTGDPTRDRGLRRPRQHHFKDELGPNMLIKQGAKVVQQWVDVTRIITDERLRLSGAVVSE